MGISRYQLGKKHALAGIRAMAHRKCKRYDSQSANTSYVNGYSAGMKERIANGKGVELDYSQPLNNRNFW